MAVARALVSKPSLILADEPTGNLDSKSEEEILALFKRLHEGGNTLVIVTHNEAVAERVERTIAVRDGRVTSDTSRG